MSPSASSTDSPIDRVLSGLGVLRGTPTSSPSAKGTAANAASGPPAPCDGPFLPAEPTSVSETGLSPAFLETLLLKHLLAQGTAPGRDLADAVRLPFPLVMDALREMKNDQLVAYKRSCGMHDFEHELTAAGFERARRLYEQCTFHGSAPVPWDAYVASVSAQSPRREVPTADDLSRALSDLQVNREIFSQIGEAISSVSAIFLFGAPGNGKTSIAERLTAAFGPTLWIPRTVLVDGEVMRLYDPLVHRERSAAAAARGDGARFDKRWVLIDRPTVVVGGELTLENLEMRADRTTGIVEAPVQLKSNCGTLVVDDFGRQRCAAGELLNRWIVPLEKRYDYLNTPGGKKVQVPFDQLVVFATNLEPKHLVDEAFLRRIPYKIQARDPSEAEFRALFGTLAPRLELRMGEGALDHLVETHYRGAGRPFRYCHARDLLTQVRNHCRFHGTDPVVTPATFDSAVRNYFSDL